MWIALLALAAAETWPDVAVRPLPSHLGAEESAVVEGAGAAATLWLQWLELGHGMATGHVGVIAPPAVVDGRSWWVSIGSDLDLDRVAPGSVVIVDGGSIRNPREDVVAIVQEGPPRFLRGQDASLTSYLLVGALRGWADLDGDGQVTASEAAVWADGILGLLLGEEAPAIRAYGDVDAVLADTAERAPSRALFTSLAAQTGRPLVSLGLWEDVLGGDIGRETHINSGLWVIDRPRFTVAPGIGGSVTLRSAANPTCAAADLGVRLLWRPVHWAGDSSGAKGELEVRPTGNLIFGACMTFGPFRTMTGAGMGIEVTEDGLRVPAPFDVIDRVALVDMRVRVGCEILSKGPVTFGLAVDPGIRLNLPEVVGARRSPEEDPDANWDWDDWNRVAASPYPSEFFVRAALSASVRL